MLASRRQLTGCCHTAAPHLYDGKIAAGMSCHAALRALSNRWLEVLWHCLARGVPYNEATHQANRQRGAGRAA